MSANPKYKLSKYNIIFERCDSYYIWNTVSGALLRIDEDARSYIESYNGYETESEYFYILKVNGFLIDADYDETAKLLSDERETMLNQHPQKMQYTIAPGLGCNYDCVYCFEKNRTSLKTMDRDMQDKVCDYIIEKAKENYNLRQIAITWFGGEPLLYISAIKYMSEKLMQYCDQNGIVYTAGIVTNGRFLTPQISKMLKSYNVKYVQLAVDGMKEHYTELKRANDGDFDAVIKNICDSADIIPITIRINSENNTYEAIKLTDYLLKDCKLDGRIKIYLAHIRDYENRTYEDEVAAHKSFLKEEGNYIELFNNSKVFNQSSLFYTAPKRRCTTCPTVCATNYCIGPEGELYRCEHFFGQPDHRVGSIGEINSNNNVYLNHVHPDKCKNCGLFPICLGGCKNDVKGDRVSIACEDFIQRQIDYLMLAIKNELF